jgi:hypothetical protein
MRILVGAALARGPRLRARAAFPLSAPTRARRAPRAPAARVRFHARASKRSLCEVSKRLPSRRLLSPLTVPLPLRGQSRRADQVAQVRDALSPALPLRPADGVSQPAAPLPAARAMHGSVRPRELPSVSCLIHTRLYKSADPCLSLKSADLYLSLDPAARDLHRHARVSAG